jgi:hypothetical protein
MNRQYRWATLMFWVITETMRTEDSSFAKPFYSLATVTGQGRIFEREEQTKILKSHTPTK